MHRILRAKGRGYKAWAENALRCGETLIGQMRGCQYYASERVTCNASVRTHQWKRMSSLALEGHNSMPRSLTLTLLIVLMSLTSTAGNCEALSAGQTDSKDSPRISEDDFKVNGVGLGDAYAYVRQRFGEPQLESKEKVPGGNCGGPHTSLTLNYPGVKIGLRGAPSGRKFRVVSVEVTDPLREVSPGLVVGMNEEAARSRLGAPGAVMAETGKRAFFYETKGDSGSIALIFRGDTLIGIHWAYKCPAATQPRRTTNAPKLRP